MFEPHKSGLRTSLAKLLENKDFDARNINKDVRKNQIGAHIRV